MAARPPLAQCLSCGSTNVAPVFLSLIPAIYYKCLACKATFRGGPARPEPPEKPKA